MKNLTEIKMANEHHSNPIIGFFYLCSGALLSLLQSSDIYYQGAFDLIKAFFVGGMGAIGAYVFKTYFIEKWHKYLKDKSKDICK